MEVVVDVEYGRREFSAKGKFRYFAHHASIVTNHDKAFLALSSG